MRSCGDCQACCIAPAITELEKPPNTSCKHLVQQGCGIYAQRPEVCKSFVCAWLAGHPAFTGAMRPDRFGVMAHVERIFGVKTWMLTELRPDALVSEEAKLLIRDLRKQHPIAEIRSSRLPVVP